MAEAGSMAGAGHGGPGHDTPSDPGKRDFVGLLTTALAAVGVGAVAWPFIDQMNPAADTLALSTTEVDIGAVAEGQGITVVWRGKPVFIRHRTAAEIETARSVPTGTLPDPQTDQDRAPREQWLVVLGICTHLGCVPLGTKSTDPRGEFGGWFCPCHGSHYDTAGRIRKGPAPRNLEVPTYAFTSDTQIRIG